MEMIAMLNGLGATPTQLDRYLTSQARSVITDSDYNANLAGVPPGGNVTLKQRGNWQRRGLQPGLSLTAAATLQAAPTTALSVADQVRANSIASQQFSNVLAGIPESPAEAARAARAGIIASQQFDPRVVQLQGLGALSPQDLAKVASELRDLAADELARLEAAVKSGIDFTSKAGKTLSAAVLVEIRPLVAAESNRRMYLKLGLAAAAVVAGVYVYRRSMRRG
jgi:hypothetical protein